MALDLSAFNLHTKETEAFMLQLVTNILCHLFIGLCTDPPSPQKKSEKEGRGSAHRLSLYNPHKQLSYL